jgi:hypothetical protein
MISFLVCKSQTKVAALLATLALFGTATVSRAGDVLITAPGPGVDTVNWAQLGVGYTNLTSPTPPAVTQAGNTVVATSAGGVFQLRDQNTTGTFVGWQGNMPPGTSVLWDNQAGPDITLTFLHPESAFGEYIQQDDFGAFIAEIFVNGVLLGTENGDSEDNLLGNAIFLGVSGGGINTVTYELTCCSSPNDFGIGGASYDVVVPPPSSTPLPSTWTFMLIGLLGLGFVACRRARQQVGLATA